jgi:hypothetical protein
MVGASFVVREINTLGKLSFGNISCIAIKNRRAFWQSPTLPTRIAPSKYDYYSLYWRLWRRHI